MLFLSKDRIDVGFDSRELADDVEQVLGGYARLWGLFHDLSLMYCVTLGELFLCVLLPFFYLVDAFET